MSNQFGIDMGELATDLIQEFSGGLGTVLFRRETGNTYDPDTGEMVPAYTDAYISVVFDELDDSLEAEYRQKHMLVIIAGNDVISQPIVGDIIGNKLNQHFRIVEVIHDQYDACFFCHVQRKPL